MINILTTFRIASCLFITISSNFMCIALNFLLSFYHLVTASQFLLIMVYLLITLIYFRRNETRIIALFTNHYYFSACFCGKHFKLAVYTHIRLFIRLDYLFVDLRNNIFVILLPIQPYR
jgi:hypothetical protein